MENFEQHAKKRGVTIDLLVKGLELLENEWEPYTRKGAKIMSDKVLKRLHNKACGNLILVTAVNPTSKGEGKTSTAVSLTQGLGYIGKKAILTLREQSRAPIYGSKGEGTGTGSAKVILGLDPSGDFDAVATAHNLCSAVISHHLYREVEGKVNHLQIDRNKIVWPWVIDLNSGMLRHATIGKGFEILGRKIDIAHDTEWHVTAASEVMAILALSEDMPELRMMLDKIIVGFDTNSIPITAKDIKVSGAMAKELHDRNVLFPNLGQTSEGQPIFVHTGPFANIAHGCNSIISLKLALKLSDYTITEAGFGADLGAEKFFDIVCRKAGLTPSLVILVATVKSLIEHGNFPENEHESLVRGFSNLDCHIENIKKFGVPIIVAINKFPDDKPEYILAIKKHCTERQVRVELNEGVALGGKGAEALALAAVEVIAHQESNFKPLYKLNDSIRNKVNTIACEIYGAAGVEYSKRALEDIERIEKIGYGNLPISIAKTQFSLSHDPKSKGAPRDWKLPINEVRLSAGAGLIIPVAGNISLMPALPLKSTPGYERFYEFGNSEKLE